MSAVRPVPSWEAPPGHVHERMLATSDWRLVVGEKRCRLMQAARGCGKPAIAELNRARHGKPDNWWAYCAEHMFGRWVEDGRVWQWRVVPEPIPFAKVEVLIADLNADIAWQRKTYGNSTDPAEKSAVGRLIGMEDALRMVRQHLTPKGGTDADR